MIWAIQQDSGQLKIGFIKHEMINISTTFHMLVLLSENFVFAVKLLIMSAFPWNSSMTCTPYSYRN